MLQAKDTISFLGRIVGFVKLLENGKIIYKNNIDHINDCLDEIVEYVLKYQSSFCLLDKPVQVYMFKTENIYHLFLISAKLEKQLIQQIEDLRYKVNGLMKVINHSFDGIVIANKNGIIVHQNPAYEKITGLSAKELIGRNLKDLEKDGTIDVSASLKAIRENKEVTIVQNIKSGPQVLVSAVPIHNKSGEIEQVVSSVRDLTKLNLLEKEVKRLEKQNKLVSDKLKELQIQNDPKHSIISHSKQMKEVVDRAIRVAKVDSVVLIQGESGVGKEKIVDLIHSESNRKAKPLIKINCGGIPEDLLESELFGYEPGAFTGASRSGKKGLLEVANNGTVFLDEIAEMSLRLQVKLLRFLQEYQFTRVGGLTPIHVDVRIIAATNKDLKAMVNEGTFRSDLFYRLNIIPIYIPPLRKRKEDIIPLIYYFLQKVYQKYGIKRSFTKEALYFFEHFDWPGNVRQLENFVERIVLMSSDDEIDLKAIQQELKYSLPSKNSDESLGINDTNFHIKPLKEQINEYEKNIIEYVLPLFPSIRKAAEALQIDQSTLIRKMERYNIKKWK